MVVIQKNYYSTRKIYNFLTEGDVYIIILQRKAQETMGAVKQLGYNPQQEDPVRLRLQNNSKKDWNEGLLTNHDRLNFYLKDYINFICEENDIVILPFCSEVSHGNDTDKMYNLSTSLYTLSLNMIIGDYLHAHLIKSI